MQRLGFIFHFLRFLTVSKNLLNPEKGGSLPKIPENLRSYVCNYIWAGQSKFTYPFITHGLSLNAYFKTGTQLLTNAVAHSLGLDLKFVKEKF